MNKNNTFVSHETLIYTKKQQKSKHPGPTTEHINRKSTQNEELTDLKQSDRYINLLIR